MADNNMVNDIVNDIASLSQRIDGLETNASNAISIARIRKVYPTIRLRMNVRVFRQRGLFPSDSIFPSGALFIGGNTVLTRDSEV